MIVLLALVLAHEIWLSLLLVILLQMQRQASEICCWIVKFSHGSMGAEVMLACSNASIRGNIVIVLFQISFLIRIGLSLILIILRFDVLVRSYNSINMLANLLNIVKKCIIGRVAKPHLVLILPTHAVQLRQVIAIVDSIYLVSLKRIVMRFMKILGWIY